MESRRELLGGPLEKPQLTKDGGKVVKIELPIHISKVSPMADGKPTRVRFATKADGSKVRVAAKGGKDGKAAAAVELEAYKKKLISERIVVGTDYWQERIAERQAKLVEDHKQLILPKLLTDPRAVTPEAQPKKDYTFRRELVTA